jgi:hypothetical protein
MFSLAGRFRSAVGLIRRVFDFSGSDSLAEVLFQGNVYFQREGLVGRTYLFQRKSN